MNILVTAGNTQVAIDRVRCITNIFTGRTGTSLAVEAYQRGHAVTLLTSHPAVVDEFMGSLPVEPKRWQVVEYRTFEGLRQLMEENISAGNSKAVIHCAAVSDFLTAGVFTSAPGTHFDALTHHWQADAGPPSLLSRHEGKIKSDATEVWLRLTPAPKLVDKIRRDWGFGGLLVKFKLEVGVSDARLLEIAEISRRQSQADLMVANTLEEASSWAYLGPIGNGYQKLARRDLPAKLLDALEKLLPLNSE